MKTIKSQSVPKKDDLIEVLKKEFGNDFSFDLDKNDNLIVKKDSSMIGARITIENQDLKVEGTITSKVASAIISLLSVTYMNVFGLFSRPMSIFENDVFLALERSYR